MNGYEASIRPLAMAVEKAREAEKGGPFYGVGGAGLSNVVPPRTEDQRTSYDASRDPRLRGKGS